METNLLILASLKFSSVFAGRSQVTGDKPYLPLSFSEDETVIAGNGKTLMKNLESLPGAAT